MEQKHFVAIDLGATSGRTILGTIANEKIQLEEINRFPNRIIECNGHFYWDIYALYECIIDGLKKVADKKVPITSIGIDTWGVDFVFIGKDGELLRQPYSYRDPHTVGAPEEFFKRMPCDKLYSLTGIQIMNFNSVFQLDTIRRTNSSVLPVTDKILFFPDALSYMLTGEKVTEYTIASTSQMINPETKKWDPEILNLLELSEEHFGRFVMPGETVGTLNASVRRITGLDAVPVVAVAGHATARAVAAVPAEGKHFAYLSSGTWSLMGIEVDQPIISEESYNMNYTNEGGIEGTIRFLKNICGMWLLESCRKENSEMAAMSYPELIELAKIAPAFTCLINPDSPCFANPPSMIEAIKSYCEKTGQHVPESYGEIVRCIFESLALRYRQVLEALKEMSPFPIERLYVIGGGSRNDLLNSFTANAIGIPVVSGPAEATAIGNIMIQAKSAGCVSGIDGMRKMIRESENLKVFTPEYVKHWQNGYDRYLCVFRSDL